MTGCPYSCAATSGAVEYEGLLLGLEELQSFVDEMEGSSEEATKGKFSKDGEIQGRNPSTAFPERRLRFRDF